MGDIVTRMNTWYPPERAQSWDRVGLILGDLRCHAKKLLLALDPVADTVEEALDEKVDMMIVHHPLYLRGTSFLPQSDPKGRLVAKLIRSDIALFAAHTNADCSPEGTGDALADLLGIRDAVPLVQSGEDEEGRPYGHGRIGAITPMRLGDFADLVARRLPAGPTGLFCSGDEDARIAKVAVCPGAGDSFLEAARAAKADALLSADLRHHPALEHRESGAPALLCASHWATESVWMPRLAERLHSSAKAANVDLEVKVSTIATEPWMSHRPTLGGLL